MGAIRHPELQRVGEWVPQAAFGTSDVGMRFSMMEGQSDGCMLPSQFNRFKQLQERISSCLSLKGEVETKQLSSIVILGATGVGKIVQESRWILSARHEKPEGPER